jgi:hypothetical protein
MGETVNLDGQQGLVTVEIQRERTGGMLPSEFETVRPFSE